MNGPFARTASGRAPRRDSARAASAVLAAALLLGAAACAGPPEPVKTDPELAQAAKDANLAFAAGRAEFAAALFGKALQRARAMDDPAAIADGAYNLAACLLALGDAPAAEVYLREARAAAERSSGLLAEILLLQAECARAAGSPEDAAAFCQAAVDLPGAEEDERLLAQAALIRTRLACDAGALEKARRELEAAGPLLAEAGEPVLHARGDELRGRICEMEGDFAAAAAAFDSQAGRLQEAGFFAEMAGALVRSGHAFLEAGLAGKAAERFYRAAASYHGQGQAALARDAADVARGAALQAGDAGVLPLVEALAREIAGRE